MVCKMVTILEFRVSRHGGIQGSCLKPETWHLKPVWFRLSELGKENAVQHQGLAVSLTHKGGITYT